MKSKAKKRHLSSKITYTGTGKTPTNIQLIQYGESGHTEEKITGWEGILSRINDQTVSWIRVSGLNDPDLIINLVKGFGLTIMDAKDILDIQQIITVEEYDNNVFVSLPAQYNNDEGEDITEHIALILGNNYVVSFQENDNLLFEGVIASIKENIHRINNKKADFLFANLLNVVIDNYSDCVSILEEDLENLEDKLLDINNLEKNLIGSIQEKRREMIRLRKLLLPFKGEFAKLLRVDTALIGEMEIPYYKDIYDQLLYILQNIESCREIMSSLVDLYLNNNDVQMNEVMKRLTVVSTIFIPLTFLVGVWGMNFDIMPELDWRYGYLFSWAVMIIIALYLIWFMKKKGWL